MHHYRCQNVYISTTASERIVDTLEFFPHNYQMPQLLSTDILIMAAKDMTDALQNPNLEVPFARVGDDTISALAELAAVKLLPLPQPPVRARTDARTNPESHPNKECARARVRCLNTEPKCHYCPITLVMS
jgi:hypothetical protein